MTKTILWLFISALMVSTEAITVEHHLTELPLQYNTALMYINAGNIHSPENVQNRPRPERDFARIAARTRSIVIDLKDIANQFLQFHETPPLKEDNLIV